MTRTTSARIAGVTFLLYILVAFPGMVLSGRATGGEGTAAKLASIAAHAADMRAAMVLTLLGCFCALVLAVTLYAITRDVDPDLSLLILVFRAGEGVIGAVSLDRMAGQLWLATVSGTAAPDPAAAAALGAVLLKLPEDMAVTASFFAVGSLVFSWLLLRGRLVPAALAWIGVVASILAVVAMPLQFAGILRGPITQLVWLPMIAFEVPLGFWLIFKGVRAPSQRQPA
jgi:uncharacterized protein DUF4386